MSDNNNYLPLSIDVNPYNQRRDITISGAENIVEETSKNVIVNGDINYVASDCKNINILASSGCIVYPESSDITIINSSGVIIDSSGVIYISNVEISDYSFTDDSNSHKVVLSDYTIQEKDKCIVVNISDITVTVPSFTDLGYSQTLDLDGNYKSGGKVVTIKNATQGDIYVSTSSVAQFECDEIDTPMTLKKTESVTLLITTLDCGDTILII